MHIVVCLVCRYNISNYKDSEPKLKTFVAGLIWLSNSVLSKLFTKKFLGIDVGTASVRIVELEKSGQKIGLSNYGGVDLDLVETDVPKLTGKAMAAFSVDEIAEIIQALMSQAKIKTRQCAFSIPDFSTFFTNFSLPPMTKKELPEAVLFEARQHIPLPIENVTVDWQLVGGGFNTPQKIEVTVAAVPNEIVARYKEIAQKAKLEMLLLEAEMFGLAQALVPADETRPVCLIDIGAQSTVCSLIENRILRYSHSFDRGSVYLANELISRLPLEPETTEDIKQNYGLKFVSYMDPEIREKIKEMLGELLAPIFREVEMMFAEYRRIGTSEVAKIIFSGGAFAIAEIKDQFSNHFKTDVEIADPFKGIDYPAQIAAELKSIGPTYAVAVGMARRGLELAQK